MELSKKIENQIIKDLEKEGWADYLHKGSAVSEIIADAAEKVFHRENKRREEVREQKRLRIIDNIYADTLEKMVKDIMHRVKDCENYIETSCQEDSQKKHDVEIEIMQLAKMAEPVIKNIKYAFHLFYSDEMQEFVKKHRLSV